MLHKVEGKAENRRRHNIRTRHNIKLVRRKKVRLPKYIKVVLAVLLAYLIFLFAWGGYQIWDLNNKIAELEKEKALFKKQQQSLEKEIRDLQDPEIIEKIARESLGMVKPGEILLIPAVPGEDIPKPKDVAKHDLAE